MPSIEQNRPPQGLRHLGPQRGCELRRDLVTLLRAFGAELDFDELVLLEGVLDGLGDAFGQAVFAELHDRFEMVSEGAEVAALLSGEGSGRLGGGGRGHGARRVASLPPELARNFRCRTGESVVDKPAPRAPARLGIEMQLSYDDLFRPFFEAMKPQASFRIGAEAEKFGVCTKTLQAIPYEGERSVRLILERLVERYGFSRYTETENGPLIALERGRESITLEPGGQLELSGAPLPDIHAIEDEVQTHLGEIRAVSADLDIAWLGVGFHPFARQADLSWVPKLRYEVMKSYLPTRGALALDMMRRTSTVQANFDYASEEDAMRKLRVSLKLSPLVTAMFANSPFYEGKMTGELSHRARIWLAVDPDRQGLVPMVWSEKASLRDYIEWALDAPMFLVKRGDTIIKNTGQPFRDFLEHGASGERAEMVDWKTHLNTLFPEVRLKNTLEVRGADSLPEHLASALPALWTGILYDDKALAEADELCADWRFDEVERLRPEIADKALLATFRGKPLADLAVKLLDIARSGLSRRGHLSASGEDETKYLVELSKLTEHARCPANELVDGLSNDDPDLGAKILQRTLI